MYSNINCVYILITTLWNKMILIKKFIHEKEEYERHVNWYTLNLNTNMSKKKTKKNFPDTKISKRNLCLSLNVPRLRWNDYHVYFLCLKLLPLQAFVFFLGGRVVYIALKPALHRYDIGNVKSMKITLILMINDWVFLNEQPKWSQICSEVLQFQPSVISDFCQLVPFGNS